MKLLPKDWLNTLFQLRPAHIARSRRSVRQSPVSEWLESRVVLAAHTWTGAAGTAIWSDSGNWIGGAPTSAEDSIELYFPSNAHFDSEFGGTNDVVISKCDIDFENPILAIYATGSLTGMGFESLNAASNVGADILIEINEGLSLPVNGVAGGIHVGQFVPAGATASSTAAGTLSLNLIGNIDMPAGDLSVSIASGTSLEIGNVAQVDPSSTSRLVTSGTGSLALGITDFDIIEVRDSAVSANDALSLGPAGQNTSLRLHGIGSLTVDDSLPDTKDIEFNGTLSAIPSLNVFGQVDGDVTIFGAGGLGGSMDFRGQLHGDGLLQIVASNVSILNTQPGFIGDVLVRGTLTLNHADALGPSADPSTITLARDARLELNDGVELPATKSLRLGRFTTLATSGTAAVHGSITAQTASDVTILTQGEFSELVIDGMLNLPRQRVIKTGEGKLSFNSISQHTNGTEIRSGSISINATKALGTGAVSLASDTELQINVDGMQAFGNALIALPSTLNQMQGPSVVLSGLESTAEVSLTGNITLNETLTFDVQSPNAKLISKGTVAGIGGLTKSGPGQLVLANSSANTFTGTTTVSEGNLVLDAHVDGGAPVVATSKNIHVTSGSLIVDRDGQIDPSASISLRGFAGLDIEADVDLTLERLDIAVGGVFLGNNGTLTITDSLRLYGADVVLGAGSQFILAGDAPRILVDGVSQVYGEGSIEIAQSGATIEVVGSETDRALPEGETERRTIDGEVVFFTSASFNGPGNIPNAASVELNVTGGGIAVIGNQSDFSGITRVENALLEVDGSLDQSHIVVGENGVLGGVGSVKSVLVEEHGAVDSGYFAPVSASDELPVFSEFLTLTVLGNLEFMSGVENALHFDLDPNPNGIEIFDTELSTPFVPEFFLDRVDVEGQLILGSGTILSLSPEFAEVDEDVTVLRAVAIIGDFGSVSPADTFSIEITDEFITILGQQQFQFPDAGGSFVVTANEQENGGALIEVREASAAPDSEALLSFFANGITNLEVIGSANNDQLRVVDPSGYLAYLKFDGRGGNDILALDDFDELELVVNELPGNAVGIDYYSFADEDADDPTMVLETVDVKTIDASGSIPDFASVYLTNAADIVEIKEFSTDIADTRYIVSTAARELIFDIEFAELLVDGLDGADTVRVTSQARPELEPLHIDGGSGDDTLIGHLSHDRLHGQSGNDVVLGGGGNDEVYGGDGNDTVRGQAGNDSVSGDAGNDIIDGGSGISDVLEEIVIDDFVLLNGTTTGNGADQFVNIEAVSLIGSTGDDRIDASAYIGPVTIDGDLGNDVIIGTAFADVITGGAGNDLIYGRAGNDQLYGSFGNDTLLGEGGNDFLFGGSDDDNINGQAGDDTLSGGEGNDRLNGGSGAQDVLFERVLENLTLTDGQMSGMGTDSFSAIESVQLLGNDADNVIDASAYSARVTIAGGAGNDRLLASKLGTRISGGDGNDVIIGNIGEDTLLGGAGNDSLSGGAASDIVLGEAGDDVVAGNGQTDILSGGGSSNDRVNGTTVERREDFVFSLDGVLAQLLNLSATLNRTF